MATRSKKEIAEDIAQKLLQKDRDEAAEFITEFAKQVEPQMVKVPENVFRTCFLPYLIGQAEATEENNPIAHWRGLVGSPSMPAEVVDMTGKTLFVVPPLYDTERVDTTRQRPGRLSRAYQDFEQTQGNRPIESAKRLAGSIADEIVEYHEGLRESKYSWDDCFRYYGLNKQPEEGKQAEGGKKPENKIDPDEFILD